MNLIPFSYGDNLIRVVNNEETNEPTWVAKDVCEVLGYKNTRDAVIKLDDDEKGESEIPTPSGIQTMTTINESGLYTLILRSNKPEAKPFKKWVTHEVLPSIRKTGGYNMGGSAASIDYAPILAEVKNFLANLETKLDVQREETAKALALINTEIEDYKFFAISMKSAVEGSVLKVARYQEDVRKTISDTYNYLKYQPMSREERHRLSMRVEERAAALAHGGITKQEATKRVYQEICRAFKIKSYHDLERSKFAQAYEFIPEITINGYCLPPLEVKDDFEERWGIDKTNGSRGRTIWGDIPEVE